MPEKPKQVKKRKAENPISKGNKKKRKLSGDSQPKRFKKNQEANGKSSSKQKTKKKVKKVAM